MREKEKAMTHDELMIIKKNEHEKRKQERVVILNEQRQKEIILDPEFK